MGQHKMVNSYGYRAGTRDLFTKKYKKRGMPNLTRYLTTFKAGDYVNVVGDPAIQKSLPHKVYHGKTGVVWNVTRRAVGVIVNKLSWIGDGWCNDGTYGYYFNCD